MCKSTSSEGPATTGPSLQTLFRSPSGSMSLCPICHTFGITFGCLHLNLDSEAIAALGQLLERLSSVELRDGQCHTVRLGGTPATLLLARRELADFRRIVLQGQHAALASRATTHVPLPNETSATWVH